MTTGNTLLKGKRVALVGGDERELEILRLMLAEGMEVKAIGLPKQAAEILGKEQEKTMADALRGSEAIVMPIPAPYEDDSVFAPSWPEKIRLTAEDLALTDGKPVVVTGQFSQRQKSLLEKHGAALFEYEGDDELMIDRSRAIAEGVLKVLIENTDVTIHRTNVFLLGFGRVSVTVCRELLAVGAHLTVVARNKVQLARAYEMGAEVLHLNDLEEHISDARIIVNGIPARVLDASLIEKTAPDVLLVDLVVPPGGIDGDAAKRLGRKYVWARGLGSRAPITVGRSQWKGVKSLLLQGFAGK